MPEYPHTTVWLLPVVMVALLACQGQPGSRESVPDAAVFDSVVEAFKAQSSYKATIRMKGADINQLLEVSYVNMDQSEHRWKAYASMYDLGTGRNLVFDSIYSSSCLRRMQPEPDTRQYHEHSGWWTKDNQGVRTPPVPMAVLRVAPQVNWHVVDSNDSEIVLGHEPDAGGLTRMLYVDRETNLLNREETRMGEVAIDVEYGRYGIDDVSVVHTGPFDCKRRNRPE